MGVRFHSVNLQVISEKEKVKDINGREKAEDKLGTGRVGPNAFIN